MRDLTSTLGSPAKTLSISAMASGLLFSMPRMNFSLWRYSFSRATPLTIRSLWSTIVRWSLVIKGSHSAPFISTVLMGPRRIASSFAHRGKAAPPRPTMPLSLTAARKLSRSCTSGGFTSGETSILPSETMRMALVFRPVSLV